MIVYHTDCSAERDKGFDLRCADAGVVQCSRHPAGLGPSTAGLVPAGGGCADDSLVFNLRSAISYTSPSEVLRRAAVNSTREIKLLGWDCL